jgi:protein-L-isoaspartate(D-aspartate) O-methyltransferase
LSTVPQNKDLKRLVRARMAETGENYTQALTAFELRGAMVDHVVSAFGPGKHLGRELPEAVIAALRRVPRHLFTPGVPLARAYEDTSSIVTKRNKRGASLSSVTVPYLAAGMIAQLDVRPGQSVLEIGSGGYQAALLRELVGPDGSVTTMDIDPEVAGRARACLDAAGYRDVRVLCADGEFGAPQYAPFDRIIVAVQAWDIRPAWTEQLAPDGRLVVPLLTGGWSMTWELDRAEGHLVSRSIMPGGFVPMRGAGQNPGRWLVKLDEAGVNLWGDEPPGADGAALAGVLAGVLAAERCEAWTGVTLPPNTPLALPNLWLATVPGLCWVYASRGAVDRGVALGNWTVNAPALADGGSLAIRGNVRPADDERTAFEFGVYGYGPRGAELAERLAEQYRVWDRDHRHGPGPVLTIHPADTPASELPPGHVFRKPHTTMVLSWPGAA